MVEMQSPDCDYALRYDVHSPLSLELWITSYHRTGRWQLGGSTTGPEPVRQDEVALIAMTARCIMRELDNSNTGGASL
ncbi:hypothetical protein CF319_g1625 [Tilletia indica]|nr:hypothetical protein CF319_g1625 [Tilletia indica]